MTRIECIVRPERLGEIQDALADLGITGLTVSEVRGRGRQAGYSDRYGGREYQVRLLPKIAIELVVADDRVTAAVEAIGAAAWTGEIGDGKIFLSRVDEAIRIRTGERGEAAL